MAAQRNLDHQLSLPERVLPTSARYPRVGEPWLAYRARVKAFPSEKRLLTTWHSGPCWTLQISRRKSSDKVADFPEIQSQ
jgi:hypothetical protein